jgi:hypothetical protein
LKDVKTETDAGDVIWNNRSILYKNRTLLFPKWVEAGILYIKQVVGNNGEILAYDTLRVILPTHAAFLMEYNALRIAISNVQHITFGEVNEDGVTIVQNVLRAQLKSNDIMHRFYVSPIAQHFGERKFPQFHFNWEYIWSVGPKSCKEPRIVSQQWKLLNNIYPTNIL